VRVHIGCGRRDEIRRICRRARDETTDGLAEDLVTTASQSDTPLTARLASSYCSLIHNYWWECQLERTVRTVELYVNLVNRQNAFM